MQKLRWCLLVVAVASFLGACAQKVDPYANPNIKPCIIPSDLPDTPAGRLGIRTIKIAHTYRIIIPTDTVFEVRSAEIKDSAYPGLKELAQQLKRFAPLQMGVTGYTDSLGSYFDDQKLSEQQARSLITFLWTQGVPHECLIPIGIGKDERNTIASNRSVEGSLANRRLEITFTSAK
jgi:outer membrane protein OmpA-like peptidoglycan-associated protein